MKEMLMLVIPTIILFCLKIFHVISWSWWVIFAPIWAPISLLLVVAFVTNTIFELMGKHEEKRYEQQNKKD